MITNHSFKVPVSQAMHKLIDDSFRNEEMRKEAYDYVAYHEKTDLPFGTLAIVHHDMLGGKNPSIFHVAAAIELIILSFNILDDWQDQDNDKPPWMKNKTGQPLTIETGFLFLAMSVLYRQSKTLINNDCLQTIIEQINRSIYGQFSDIQNVPGNEEDYINIIRQKSGALAAMACLAGSLMSGKTYDLLPIEHYSTEIGICAQLQNDLEDVLHLNEKNDIIHRKRTIATMYLIDHPSVMGQRIAWFYDSSLSKLDLLSDREALEQWIHSSGVVLYIKAMKAVHQIRAEKEIEKLPVAEQDKELIKQFLV